MPGTIDAWLGHAKALLDTLGLGYYVGALAVIALVAAVVNYFFGHK